MSELTTRRSTRWPSRSAGQFAPCAGRASHDFVRWNKWKDFLLSTDRSPQNGDESSIVRHGSFEFPEFGATIVKRKSFRVIFRLRQADSSVGIENIVESWNRRARSINRAPADNINNRSTVGALEASLDRRDSPAKSNYRLSCSASLIWRNDRLK